jgi:uncharacterized membrane protein YeiH
MQYLLEHFGVTVAAITGVLAARGKQVDLFGVITLALVTAFGGGTMRDLLLSQPVFWTLDERFLLNGVLTAAATFILVRYKELPGSVLLVADAFALAFFTMLGTRKGLACNVAPSIAVAMGVITGVVGGMIRDVLVGVIPLVFRQSIYLYATAALVGASVYALLANYVPHWQGNLIIGTLVTLLLRLAGIRWRVTLPEFKHTTEHKS